jgi:hypothetical protein
MMADIIDLTRNELSFKRKPKIVIPVPPVKNQWLKRDDKKIIYPFRIAIFL